jgi:hypothetical protein
MARDEMIEIIPHDNSFRGSYSVQSVVDSDAYVYIYNEVFVENWNQFITKMKANSHFFKSKWIPAEFETANSQSSKTLSREEMLAAARKVNEFTEHRKSKQGRYFQKLVDHFDRERNLIIYHNAEFYTYEMKSNFSDFISVYLITKSELNSILNYLYFRIKKRNRSAIREQLFRDFETDSE